MLHFHDESEGGVVIAAFDESVVEVLDVSVHSGEQSYLGEVGLHVGPEVKHQLVLVASVILFKLVVHQILDVGVILCLYGYWLDDSITLLQIVVVNDLVDDALLDASELGESGCSHITFVPTYFNQVVSQSVGIEAICSDNHFAPCIGLDSVVGV
jgi:hypothetical protein